MNNGALDIGAYEWAACAFEVFSSSTFFLMNGGSGSVNFKAGAACSWSATSGDSWVTVVSANSGIGNGMVDFEVRENFTGSARQTTISISGHLVAIVQDAGLAGDCGYLFSPGSQSYSAAGGVGVIKVTADEQCAWLAITNVSWLTITSAELGTGNGAVSYSVAANPGPGGRSAVVTISGRVFKVKQKGT